MVYLSVWWWWLRYIFGVGRDKSVRIDTTTPELERGLYIKALKPSLDLDPKTNPWIAGPAHIYKPSFP
jgi:hypothetical protein